MPQIREYTQQVSAEAGAPPTRRAAESDFGGEASYRLGQAAQGAIQDVANVSFTLQRQAAKDETAAVHAQMAVHSAGMSGRVKELAQEHKPGMPSITETIKQEHDDGIAQIKDGLTTRAASRAFETASAFSLANTLRMAAGAEAVLAGSAAVANSTTVLENHKKIVRDDPESFGTSLNAIKAAVANTAIPRHKQAELEQKYTVDLAESVVEGEMTRNPDGVPEFIKNSGLATYLPIEKQASLIKSARVESNVQRSDADRKERERHTETDELFYNKAKAGSLRMADIRASGLPVSRKEHWEAVLDKGAKGPTVGKTDESLKLLLVNKIFLPFGHPDKLTDLTQIQRAYASGKLDDPDYHRLVKQFTEASTPDGMTLGQQRANFLKGISPQINKSNPMMGRTDVSGQEQFAAFTSYAERQEAAYRKAGKDPYDLYDPSKPDYLGHKEKISPFQKTMQQSMQTMTERMRAAPGQISANPRLPGESIDTYRKRTGS